MLIARDRELATLNRLYTKRGFQFPVVYGRRRVGKTYLMAEFTRNLPCVFFTAVENSASVNLRNLSREIYAFEHPDSDPSSAPLFTDFQTAFEAVFGLARSRRLVFVIDEYPYLAKADPSVSSVLQALIDRGKDESQLYLMLCGSSLSFMKEQVLGEKSPLYGRRTAQLELRPLDYLDASRFFPSSAPEEAACYYGIAGGIPLYLEQFEDGAPLLENIEQAYLQPDAFLFEEPINLLKQEVQKAPLYNSVMEAIAEGKTGNNEIATTVGVSPAELAYYLKELQRIGLIEKERPIVDSGRRVAYKLSDNLFRFWYRFVAPYRSSVERHILTRVLGAIERYLPDYMGFVFEDMCRQWAWRCNAKETASVEFDRIGRWWGGDPVKKTEAEIDLVGTIGGEVTLLGEAKWRNEPTGERIARELKEKGALLNRSESAQRYLFSKSGFTDACADLAERDARLHLVTLDDLYAPELGE